MAGAGDMGQGGGTTVVAFPHGAHSPIPTPTPMPPTIVLVINLMFVTLGPLWAHWTFPTGCPSCLPQEPAPGS